MVVGTTRGGDLCFVLFLGVWRLGFIAISDCVLCFVVFRHERDFFDGKKVER